MPEGIRTTKVAHAMELKFMGKFQSLVQCEYIPEKSLSLDHIKYLRPQSSAQPVVSGSLKSWRVSHLTWCLSEQCFASQFLEDILPPLPAKIPSWGRILSLIGFEESGLTSSSYLSFQCVHKCPLLNMRMIFSSCTWPASLSCVTTKTEKMGKEQRDREVQTHSTQNVN